MSANLRAELLERARSLNSNGKDQLSIAALCKSTGLDRTNIRRYFPTNGALNAAISAEEPAEAQRHPLEREAPISREDWLERRLRVFERALSLLEARVEEMAHEHSHAISLPEKKISNTVSALSPVTEIPPVVANSDCRHPEPEGANPPQNASRDLPPSHPKSPNANVHQPQLEFHAREKLQSILERVHLSNPDTANDKELKPRLALPWVPILATLAFAALVLAASLIWTGRSVGAQHVLAARAGGGRQVANVVVIDATGTIPETNIQTASAGTRNIIARAERGDASAQTQAALAFLRGDGVDPDPVSAIRWSRAAAAQGEPNAQFILGSLYAEGIKPNPQLAAQWYSAAASHGNAKAMHNLAIALLNGEGVTKDPAAAIIWLTKAAKSGYRDSAFDLAVLYERGEGVAQSPQDALRWYGAAALLGDSQAAERANFLRSQLPQVGQN